MTQLTEQAAQGNAAARIPPATPAGDAAQTPAGAPGPSAAPGSAGQPVADYRPVAFPQATAAPARTAPDPAATNGMAVAALVLGIASIPFCWWGIGSLTMVVLAIVFGSLGIRRANEGAPQKNFAVAGLCCGIVGLFAYLIVGIATFGLFLLI